MTSTIGKDLQSRIVQIDKYRIHVLDSGASASAVNGRIPLVLLHGGGPGASGWSNFSRNAARLSQEYRVLIVDQPGYGQSDKPIVTDGVWTFNSYILTELLDELGIDKVNMLGNSLGGGTALKMALDYPHRVNRLVLMGPAGGALNLFSPNPSEGFKAIFSFYGAPGPSLDKMRSLIDVMTFDSTLVPDEVLSDRYAAAVTPESIEYSTKLIRAFGEKGAGLPEELWREIHLVQNKTLLVWGRDDRVMPLDGAFFLLKRMPDAQLHVFSRCGHWAQIEHTAEFNELVVSFLNESSGDDAH
jgi:pimeloyl-ACP methyl ester carboxylesterase